MNIEPNQTMNHVELLHQSAYQSYGISKLAYIKVIQDLHVRSNKWNPFDGYSIYVFDSQLLCHSFIHWLHSIQINDYTFNIDVEGVTHYTQYHNTAYHTETWFKLMEFLCSFNTIAVTISNIKPIICQCHLKMSW